jgi:SHS2 domain-containing protein
MSRRAEHVGELVLELEAGDEAGLFVEAARQLAAEEAPDVALDAAPEGAPAELALEAPDLATLLVDWVNELVYLTETTAAAYPRVEVLELGDGRLRARAWPRQVAVRHAVKAATLHDAHAGRAGDRFVARVLVDV